MTDPEQQPARGRRAPDAAQRSEALKERIYVTFTALAVTIATVREAEHATIGGAALTLLLTVVGTLLAVATAAGLGGALIAQVQPTEQALTLILLLNLGVSLVPWIAVRRLH